MNEPRVFQHLTSLKEFGYVERLSDAGGHHEQPDLYTIGPAARGTVPKRHDLVLGAMLETLISQYGPDELTRLLRETATRVTRGMSRQSEGLPFDWRCEKALALIEKELAWQTIVTAEDDDCLLVAIHACLLHEIAGLPAGACGNFFAELLASLCGTHVQEVPVKSGTACCKLKLFRKAPATEGRNG